MKFEFSGHVIRFYDGVMKWNVSRHKCAIWGTYCYKHWEIQLYIPELLVTNKRFRLMFDTGFVFRRDRVEIAFVIFGFGVGLWINEEVAV